MDQVFIDEETGESIIEPLINHHEEQQRGVHVSPVNNAETGEPETGVAAGVQRRRVPFQERDGVLNAPKSENSERNSNTSRWKTNLKKSSIQKIPREIKEELSSSDNNKKKKNDERFIDVEPVSRGSSFAQSNPVLLFLLPIVYFQWIVVLITMFEVVFHVWTHHKNKSLKDSHVFFRSPFHGVTSEFCALCQNETCMDRVGKMQEIRMHKLLRQCNYMKRAVT